MILTGSEIRKEITNGRISITPFEDAQINPNSYNYRLGEIIKIFTVMNGDKPVFAEIPIPEEGIVLEPRTMYLANTLESIGSTEYSMSLIGRSSVGRLGLFLQVSANLGHVNSDHQWTLELVATQKIRIYPRMIIGQVSFWENHGEKLGYDGFYGKISSIQESKTHDIDR